MHRLVVTALLLCACKDTSELETKAPHAGAIYSIGVTRDSCGHIIGFAGSATHRQSGQ